MSKFLLKSLLFSPAMLGAALAISSSAIAADAKLTEASSVDLGSVSELVQLPESNFAPVSNELSETELSTIKPEPISVAQAAPETSAPASVNTLDQLNRYGREGRASANQMGQVTSVSQLTDVRPTDWAFQALQSLVERYGCIVGYPDRTYRGNQAMTRYEFAAGLNACMDRVNELIAAGTADLVKKEDLAVLQRLQEEFAAELAVLRGRVDALEARTATLERQQFSTTTKLAGEVIFAVTDEFLDNGLRDNNTVFQNRVRLALNTSFTGKDLLVTRLAAGNADLFSIPGGGAEGIQTFNFGNTGGNQVFADWVAYFFPIGENLQFYVPAIGGFHYDYAPTFSGYFEAFDGGTGPLSIFAQRNPIYLIGGGSGIGASYNFGNIKVSGGYLADGSDGSGTAGTFAANVPSAKFGLFNGSYAALGQVGFDTGNFGVGLTYVNAYRRGAIFDAGSGLPSSGTLFSNGFFGFDPISGGLLGKFPTQVNAYGASGYFKLGSNISINAFGTYVNADDIGDGFGSAEIWSFGGGIAFADFGKKGNLLGLFAGIEPYVGNPAQYGLGNVQNKMPIHLEGFYKFQLTDNISITPGIIYIINAGQSDIGDTNALIGTLRTTFTF